MRRTALLGVAWLVGGALAVALAVAAVGRVGNEVTGSRPSPLSAEEVAQELASTTTSTTLPGAATSDTTASTAPPEVTATTATTVSSASPTTTSPPPTTAAAGETRTYALVGGTATLRFEPTGHAVARATRRRCGPRQGGAPLQVPSGPASAHSGFETAAPWRRARPPHISSAARPGARVRPGRCA